MIETGLVFYVKDVERKSIGSIQIKFKTYKIMKPKGYNQYFFYRFFTDKNTKGWYEECIPSPNDEEQIRKELEKKDLDSKVKLNFKKYLRYFDNLLEKHKWEKHWKWLEAIKKSIKNRL